MTASAPPWYEPRAPRRRLLLRAPDPPRRHAQRAGPARARILHGHLAPDRLDDVFALLEQVGEAHPEEPHWFLPAIGVDPMCQGRGYGSALLEHSLVACDRDHRVAYLEASNPRNVPLYQRFGFEVTGEMQVGDSPVVTPMQRAAR